MKYYVFFNIVAPMKNTIDDMWQMVWETGINKIVMFAEIDETGKVNG